MGVVVLSAPSLGYLSLAVLRNTKFIIIIDKNLKNSGKKHERR